MAEDSHGKRMRNQYGPVGGRAPAAEEHLWVRCRQCVLHGFPPGGGCGLCEGGFVETGYTAGRLDRLQTEVDRLLLYLDRVVAALRPGAQRDYALRALLHSHADTLEAARTRSRLTDGQLTVLKLAEGAALIERDPPPRPGPADPPPEPPHDGTS